MKSDVEMSFIPEGVREIQLIERFEAAGLVHVASGKTREMFDLPDYREYRLIYATDRVSIFDIVLNAKVEFKGYVLTANTIFWLDDFFGETENHLVDFGSGVDSFLPKELQGDSDLQKRCIIVKKADVLSIEAIVRGHLTGSGYANYKEDGTVCGFKLPDGLFDGSKLPEDLFTPSTKAPAGEKDENISFEQMVTRLGGARGLAEGVRARALSLFADANKEINRYGIVIADTKFEFGLVQNEDGSWSLILIDEVLTPDSSRFWPWEEGMVYEGAPPSFDKQGVRDWGKSVGIKKDPTQVPPDEVLAETSEKYLKIAEITLQQPLFSFWEEYMDIRVEES